LFAKFTECCEGGTVRRNVEQLLNYCLFDIQLIKFYCWQLKVEIYKTYYCTVCEN
jgi:hypothetical protein